MSIIQQLEDLKEWSKDSTRYERRLAFRGSMGTEAGTIPLEFDELSDREREYYRTGPWSTREDYRKGQLVQPGPGRQGYSGKEDWSDEAVQAAEDFYDVKIKDLNWAPGSEDRKILDQIDKNIKRNKGNFIDPDPSHSKPKKLLTTETEKAHYKRQYGKEYNVEDWESGNFEKKKDFSSGKKKKIRKPWAKRADFRASLSKYLVRDTELNKIKKRGYISISDLNKLLGGKDTQQAIDTLSEGLSNSPWVDEIKGAKRWKKSVLRPGYTLTHIEGGGKVFYKKPSEDLLKRLKSYYRNQEYLSDFKYGRVKGNTIKNVQTLYGDETLMDSIRKWTAKDKKVPLKIIEAVFGDGMTGPNSVMQLGKALKGDIEIPGVRKNVALGDKIIDAMAWEARKGRGPWQGAAYEYAKGEMDNLFELKKGQWNFNKYYNETRKIMTEAGVPGVIDEVVSLRTGFTNNQQVYSIFSQVIDADINDSYKSGYDGQFSTKQHEIRNLIANKPEGWQKKVDDLVRTHEGNYKKMKNRFGDVEFGRFGKFDVNTGTFQNPIEVFGEKRWNQLPKDIQAKILQGFDDTKMSLNVGKTQTQKELYKKTKDFLKLAPKKSLPVSYGLSSNFAVQFDDALKSDKFKGVRNFLKGELGFAALDYINSRTKGQSHEKALGKALEMASWGLKDLGADEKALIKHATEQGASEEEVGALRNYLNYMKKYKTYETANKMLHYAKENLGQGTGSPEDIGTTWEDVTSARENLKLREGELENLYNIYTEGTGDMQLGKNMLTKYIDSLAAEEWNKTAGTIIDRGSRPHQGEGLIWGLPGAITRDIGALATGQMPTNFWDWAVPAQIDPWTKDEKQIRIMERPAVGTNYPEYDLAREDMNLDFDYALPKQNYAGGGIAGIRRPWAIPPESGPMPQGGGLSSQYNRVKKLTG